MSQGGDGIHHLSRGGGGGGGGEGVTVAENLSMGVNQGNYYRYVMVYSISMVRDLIYSLTPSLDSPKG